MDKDILYYLEGRGGHLSLYHFIILNLGGLYYIDKEDYTRYANDGGKLNDTRVVYSTTTKLTYPIKIYIEKGNGPVSNTFNEAFELIKDTYILLNTIPDGEQYEIVSIYGEPVFLNTASNNPSNVFPFLRSLFLSRIDFTKNIESICGKKRFFIGRKRSIGTNTTYHTHAIRTLMNEKVFVENLKKFNICCIYLEDYTFEEKIRLFNSAELIISTNSSALTCLLWCNLDVKVIELINKAVGCGRGEHYKLICDTLGLKYYKYSDIHDDMNGNFTIENDSNIYNYIQRILDE